MVRQESFTFEERTLVRSYSDAGKFIIQDETGVMYEEAVDPVEMNRTYTESEEYINPDEHVENDEDVPDDEAIAELEAIL